MTNAKLYLAIGVPIIFNTLLVGVLIAYINAKFDGVKTGFASVDEWFKGINQRFDDMRAMWLSELHRVEEVLDARLKHLEDAK